MRLEAADYGALEVKNVIDEAGADLRVSDDEVKRQLLKHTRVDAEFRSDGDIVTFRG
jgi:hypothetical protein